jgi:hypothetical protein
VNLFTNLQSKVILHLVFTGMVLQVEHTWVNLSSEPIDKSLIGLTGYKSLELYNPNTKEGNSLLEMHFILQASLHTETS